MGARARDGPCSVRVRGQMNGRIRRRSGPLLLLPAAPVALIQSDARRGQVSLEAFNRYVRPVAGLVWPPLSLVRPAGALLVSRRWHRHHLG